MNPTQNIEKNDEMICTCIICIMRICQVDRHFLIDFVYVQRLHKYARI